MVRWATRQAGPLHARVRYFDPVKRRAGVPEDVGALVTGMTANETKVELVNLNQSYDRELIVQMGGYGEHQCGKLTVGDQEFEINDSTFRIRLAPGSGTTLVIETARYANSPTLSFPWDRTRKN